MLEKGRGARRPAVAASAAAAPRTAPAPTDSATIGCPSCGAEAERYTGANPHKIGTASCAECGRFDLADKGDAAAGA